MPPGLGEMGVKWPGRRQKMPPAQGARGQKGRGSRLPKSAVGDGAGAEPEVPRHPLPHPADDLAHGEGGGHGADPQALHLAQVKHYTRAAQQLCISQPSLSHAIRQLEGELGVPLFEKTGRNTTLTPFGETFLTTVHQTLGTLEEGVETLRRSARGEGLIRLGFLRRLGSRYIPQLAAEFLAAHPARNLSFTFHTDRTQGLVESLLHRQCDLVFCSQPDPALPLTAVPVVRQELVLITPKDHPLAGRGAVDLAQALPYPMVYFTREAGFRRVVDGLFADAGGAPRIAYETEEDQVIAGLVAQGFGIAVVPQMELLHKLEVAVLKITAPDYRWEVFLTTCDGLFLAPAARDFRDFALRRSQEGR